MSDLKRRIVFRDGGYYWRLPWADLNGEIKTTLVGPYPTLSGAYWRTRRLEALQAMSSASRHA